MENNELWLPIHGYENFYQISNFGRVKSLGRTIHTPTMYRMYKPKILKLHLNKVNGYLVIHLFKDNSRKRFFVHRLVAEHFLESVLNKPIIDHINGNKTDNRVCNLRWVNYFENSCKNILTPTTENKPILQYSLDGAFIKEYRSASNAAEELGINQANIVHCLKGKYKNSGGYIWKYKLLDKIN